MWRTVIRSLNLMLFPANVTHQLCSKLASPVNGFQLIRPDFLVTTHIAIGISSENLIIQLCPWCLVRTTHDWQDTQGKVKLCSLAMTSWTRRGFLLSESDLRYKSVG